MKYSEFLDWMFTLERFGIKLGLDNIIEFERRIGNPHLRFKSIHVAGTNGKGSVCAFLSEILLQHGLKVGLYTSPHLVDFRERIKLNGADIPERDVLRIGMELKQVMEEMRAGDPERQLTFFEFTTGLAFKFFEEQGVDIVIAEVGMGGRLDATNVIVPEVAAITRIGLEHTNYLGKTIPDIAREKAGIVKPGVPLVTCERKADALSVISTICARKAAHLRRIGEDFDVDHVRQSLTGTVFDFKGRHFINKLETRLLGSYQAENAATAIAVIEDLADRGIKISDGEIRRGLLSTRWPGRLEIVSRNPFVMFDGSHNPDGVSTTVRILSELGLTPLTFVLGCMDDKDATGIVKAIAPSASGVISTQARYKRALAVDRLGAIVRENYTGPQSSVTNADVAFAKAIEESDGKGMCVIGSLYLVGEAIQWWESVGERFARAHKV